MARFWADHTWDVVNRIEAKWPVECFTYEGHGDTGILYGIDVPVAPWGVWAEGDQFRMADEILTAVFDNWHRWGIRYAIFQDSITYEPVQKAWAYYDWTQYGKGSANVITQRHGDHVHLQVSTDPPVGQEAEVAVVRGFRPNLAAVDAADIEAAYAAAKVLVRRGFAGCTVWIGEGGVKALDKDFAKEPLGTRQMIVVGKPAYDALPPMSRPNVLYPYAPDRSDYVGAVGESYEDTLERLEGTLEAHAGEGAGAEFRAVFGAGRG